jgi:hypothetical protein
MATATRTVIERAYELAAIGTYQTIYDVSAQLSREGYDQVHQHLMGPTIRSDLRARMRSASAPRSFAAAS